jgi:hypothetical protein
MELRKDGFSFSFSFTLSFLSGSIPFLSRSRRCRCREFSHPFLGEESSIFRRERTKCRVSLQIFTTSPSRQEATFTARIFCNSPSDAAPRRAAPRHAEIRARTFEAFSGVFVLPALAPALVKLFSFSSLSSRHRTRRSRLSRRAAFDMHARIVHRRCRRRDEE